MRVQKSTTMHKSCAQVSLEYAFTMGLVSLVCALSFSVTEFDKEINEMLKNEGEAVLETVDVANAAILHQRLRAVCQIAFESELQWGFLSPTKQAECNCVWMSDDGFQTNRDGQRWVDLSAADQGYCQGIGYNAPLTITYNNQKYEISTTLGDDTQIRLNDVVITDAERSNFFYRFNLKADGTRDANNISAVTKDDEGEFVSTLFTKDANGNWVGTN